MESNSPFEEIYLKYAKPVKLYIMTLCHNSEIADDITAEAFLKAINNADKVSDENIFTWLCTIAKNTYFDFQRRRERQNVPLTEEVCADVYTPMPEECVLQRDSKMSLYVALQAINPQSREIVYLRMFTDLSFKEIGDILNISENKARIVFYRSKNKLKGMIENEK